MFAKRRILGSAALGRWERRLHPLTKVMIRVVSVLQRLYPVVRLLYWGSLVVGVSAFAVGITLPGAARHDGLAYVLAYAGLMQIGLALLLSTYVELLEPRKLTYIRGKKVLTYLDDPFVAHLVRTVGFAGKLIELFRS
jgi:hypothetical protein